MLGISRSKAGPWERSIVVLIALVSIAESLLEILSWGCLSANWRAALLFSDFTDRFKDR